MPVMDTFAKRLKALREERNLSQSELSQVLGISRGSLSFYENNERTADIEILNKVSEYFDVTLDYLLGKSDNRTPENVNIGKVTGLSDEAIAQLQITKENMPYTTVLNYLIANKHIFLLIDYLLSFLGPEIAEGEYWFVQTKEYDDPYSLPDVRFSAVIRNLPLIEKDFIDYVSEIGHDEITLEFIYNNCDLNEFYAYYSKFAGKCDVLSEAMAKENPGSEEVIPSENALRSFYNFCKAKEEGANNADNPETR